MQSSRRNNFKAGFTLIEVIVAMLMVAMLSLSLYASLNTAYNAKKVADRAIAPVRAVSTAAEIIMHDFDSIVRPSSLSIGSNAIATNSGAIGSGSPNFLRGALTGEHQQGGGGSADLIEFYTNGGDGVIDGGPMNDGIRRIQIALDTARTPPVLVRRVTRNLMSINLDQVQPDDEVLCRNVASFSLQYFDGTEFLDDWDPTQIDQDTGQYLPELIKMQIIINVDDPTAPPDTNGQVPSRPYAITRTIRMPVWQTASKTAIKP